SRRGPVAVNSTLMLEDGFKRRGFARAVYAAEEALYRRWGVREIHISAIDDGRGVWMRHFGFRPIPTEEDALRRVYLRWASLRRRSLEAPDNILELPDEFFLSLHELSLFKVLDEAS